MEDESRQVFYEYLSCVQESKGKTKGALLLVCQECGSKSLPLLQIL